MYACRAISRTLHFASPEEFVRLYVAGTPLSAVFDTVDEARLAAVVADVRDALAGYVDASGMACPMATRIVTARR